MTTGFGSSRGAEGGLQPKTPNPKRETPKNKKSQSPMPNTLCILPPILRTHGTKFDRKQCGGIHRAEVHWDQPSIPTFFCAKVGACCTPGITLRPRSGMEEIRDIIHAAQPPRRRAASCHGLATRYRTRCREVKKKFLLLDETASTQRLKWHV